MSIDIEPRSFSVKDIDLIYSFIKDPDFPFLVSFPRTGSHWLRFLMELYFEKPSFQRIFFYPDAKEFTCFHSHDIDLSLQRNNVIYLYREPIATIYSQIMYHQQDMNDEKVVIKWSKQYSQHLKKWLKKEQFTKRKTIITYEQLDRNPMAAFQEICSHLETLFLSEKFSEIYVNLNKAEVKRKTLHDKQVISNYEGYDNNRVLFAKKFGTTIEQLIEL